MMYGYDNGFTCGGGQGIFGYGSFWHMIIPILLIGLIIYAVVKLLSSNDHNGSSNHDDSLSILNKKFVNGELSEEEYIRRKKIIKSK